MTTYRQLLVFVLALLSGCTFPINDEPAMIDNGAHTMYRPLLMDREQLESSISVMPAREINRPGKMYLKDGILYLSEKFEGVHIIDNRNPYKPEKMGFIRIPGCIDIAVKGSTLYADNAVDLVAVDLSVAGDAKVVSRQPNVFPELVPPDAWEVPTRYQLSFRPENTVIVGWEPDPDA